jgi:hypothetical protein
VNGAPPVSVRIGQALHLPKELLGDVYADPYAKKKHGHAELQQAGKPLSNAEVAALKEEVGLPGGAGRGRKQFYQLINCTTCA